jgi:hypothetical protein
MPKSLLMSLVFMTFLLPMRGARNPNAVRGLRRTIAGMVAWIAIYVVILSVFKL